MAEQDLYVDLFSNSSLDIYPDNRVSTFTVKLDQPIQLQGSYECALAQLACPAALELTTSGQVVIKTYPESSVQRIGGTLATKTSPFGDANAYGSAFKPRPATLLKDRVRSPSELPTSSIHPYGFVYNISEDVRFSKADDLVDFLSSLLTKGVPPDGKMQNAVFADVIKTKSRPPADTTSGNGVLRVVIREPNFSLALSGAIARILGFNVTDGQWVIFEHAGEYSFPNQAMNLLAGRPSLLSIYTNVILPHRVGDTSAPLIRVCTMPNTSHLAGQVLNFQFEDLHYLPIALKYIQEIHVEVRGNDGALIPFTAGLLYLRLHFRSRRR